MGWFRRRRDRDVVGYQDNGLIDDVGGYRPSRYARSDAPQDKVPRAVEWRTVRRPPRRPVRIAVITVFLVIAVAVIIATQVAVSKGSGTAQPPVSGTTTVLSTRQSAPAVVPGWQAVVNDGAAVAYDVPPDWHVSYLGDGLRLEDGDWHTPMTMIASYLDNYCESATSSNRAMSGAATVPQANGVLAAQQTAKHLANFAYGPPNSGAGAPPTVLMDPPRQVKAAGLTGELVTAHVTVNQPDQCGPPSALVDVLALPNPGRHESLVVIAFADQQFIGAISKQNLDTIVTSIRRLPAH